MNNIELIKENHKRYSNQHRKSGFHTPKECKKFPTDGDMYKKYCRKCDLELYNYNELPELIKEHVNGIYEITNNRYENNKKMGEILEIYEQNKHNYRSFREFLKERGE